MEDNFADDFSGGWCVKAFPVHQGASEQVVPNREILTDSDQFDVAFDVPKPPESPNPENVFISFNHPDWNLVLGDMYLADIRSPLEDPSVKEWEIQLGSTIEDSLIPLSWTLDSFPEDMALTIENGTDDIDMLQQSSFDMPYSSEVTTLIVRAEKSPVSVGGENIAPTDFALYQNYPNPFNPSTTLRYGIPEEASVSLIIYDIRGNTVKTFTSNSKAAGWYEHSWNGLDDSGQSVSTGLYLTRLQAGSYTKTIKIFGSGFESLWAHHLKVSIRWPFLLPL